MYRIFIGSSTESIKVAEIIKDYFSKKYECTIWKDHFFELNESTYDTLIKNLSLTTMQFLLEVLMIR